MNERKLFQGNGKKSNKGITLIALVISIIVMLILAGVSLNATIGENGIVTKAQNAKLASEESKRREDLEYILYEYNSSSFLGQADGFTDYLENLKTEGRIDDYLYTDTLIVKYDGVYYETEKNGEYYEIKNKLEDDLTGGSGETGENNYIVTPDNLTNGNIEIAEGSSYVVLDEVKGEDFNFEIPAGDPVTIKIMGDMNIDNKGYKRSAIDLEEGATLNLYVYGTVEVNSGYGEDASGNVAGKGGYAGIHVPEGATLNLYGTGTLTAIGGNAGSGGTNNTTNDASAAGGGGAGAGIGGNGGNGGLGVSSGQGKSGENAENCGNVNIYNSLIVYAYGGAGGSGGAGSSKTRTAGGAGGYPAAGIGGGGAGGAGSTCCAGAGGYTGGTGDYGDESSANGLAGFNGGDGNGQIEGGGGYFLGGEGISDGNNINREIVAYGGFANQGAHGSLTGIPPEYSHMSGNGGQAGAGGNIKVSLNSKIYAFNGNLFTDGTDYQNGINQCPIYSQTGVKIAKYKYTNKSKYDLFTIELEETQQIINKSGYINKIYTEKENYITNKTLNINTKLGITGNSILTNIDMSYQGVGSGAGYTEVSNGTYTIDSSMN